MIDKPLHEVTRSALELLVETKAHEGRTLDYKRDLNIATDENKRELARDVSSFANAAGGDLVFGVEEAKDDGGKNLGYPSKLVGVECPNFDASKQRLESIIRDNVDPRIQGIAIHKIDGFERGPVIVLRVPRSWNAPHMVTFQKQTHFFSRNNAGRHPLDVREIGAAFLAGAEISAQIRRFRDERIGRIIANETPVRLADNWPRLIVHVVPIGAASRERGLVLDAISRRQVYLEPLDQASGWDGRYNLDGYVAYIGTPKASHSYSQAFRDDAIEGVSTVGSDGSPREISGLGVERGVVAALKHYIPLMRKAGVDSPLSIHISLVGVNGCYIAGDVRHLFGNAEHVVDRDLLVLPDVLVESEAADLGTMLRPPLDALWQAGGHEGSPSYERQQEPQRLSF